MAWWSSQSYIPVAQKRAKASLEALRLAKSGRAIAPVKANGRTIASTFWGRAWCDNLESYSDFDNRLPRGRTYVRNGSVVDLQIEPGKISALVSGSALYRITIEIKPLAAARWKSVKSECHGRIGSLIELLRGRLSKEVMEIVTRRNRGIFPSPEEIKLSCSCPDWADMCKHVAAVLYGVGNRLDCQPELLFKLRKVDHLELITSFPSPSAVAKKSIGRKKTISRKDLAEVFGIELAAETRAADPLRRTRSAEPLLQHQRKKGKRTSRAQSTRTTRKRLTLSTD